MQWAYEGVLFILPLCWFGLQEGCQCLELMLPYHGFKTIFKTKFSIELVDGMVALIALFCRLFRLHCFSEGIQQCWFYRGTYLGSVAVGFVGYACVLYPFHLSGPDLWPPAVSPEPWSCSSCTDQ